jgi:TRAP-type C4-dicarboxylate transport system permease small subunit
MQAMSRLLGLSLEIIAGALLVALTALVSVAATLRYAGTGISFYDEVAPILLSWVTFFGAALVALKRGHLGFDNVIRGLPEGAKRVAFVLSEALTVTFFLALAWGGYRLLGIVSGEHLVTLPWVTSAAVQSVMPIASLAYVAAELLTIPDAWRKLHTAPPAPTAVTESSHLE